jgi:hypothetical protein
MHYEDQLDTAALKRYAAALNARAVAALITGRVSADDLRGVILDSGGRCAWCECVLVGREFEIDHIISLNAGGGNIAANLAMTCPDCNRRKAGQHPARFAAQIAAQGITSPLVMRVLAHFNIEPQQQRSLFDAAPPAADDSTPPDAPPPYDWSKRTP